MRSAFISSTQQCRVLMEQRRAARIALLIEIGLLNIGRLRKWSVFLRVKNLRGDPHAVGVELADGVIIQGRVVLRACSSPRE